MKSVIISGRKRGDCGRGRARRAHFERAVNELAARASLGVGRPAEAVGDGGERAGFVEAEPGAAGFEVARGEHPQPTAGAQRGAFGRASELLVAIRAEKDRRAVEDAVGEDKSAHWGA